MALRPQLTNTFSTYEAAEEPSFSPEYVELVWGLEQSYGGYQLFTFQALPLRLHYIQRFVGEFIFHTVCLRCAYTFVGGDIKVLNTPEGKAAGRFTVIHSVCKSVEAGQIEL